ncbi:hypothetical protein GQ53DRAFT_123336, partial [Thozetella sp. PMI_491]
MGARQAAIDHALPGTCGWLFETPEFRKWCDRTDLGTHNGVLWIKGKPGAGKSTLIKHTLGHCKAIFGDHLIITHFFNARDETLEMTLLGMLRWIIYQLVKENDVLREKFILTFRDKQRMYQEGHWGWQVPELKEFVFSAVKQSRSKPLLVLVDALDECDDRDVRDVVDFLASLSMHAVQASVTLRICLSSRHYPEVGIEKSLGLVVERSEQHQGDIATYVRAKLRIQDEEIRAEIRKKADGIFMWVVIVVSLLNEAYDVGHEEAEDMRKILEGLPANLEEVFNTLLSKGSRDKAETILTLQWVLLCQRPLTPEELFAAVGGKGRPSNDRIRRRITASCKGLIEVRKGDETVQFIHLTVNDFLLRYKRLQTLDPRLEPEPISATHGHLWDRCWSYIKPQVTTSASEQHIRELNENYPFLRYTASYIFDHAEKALSGGVMREAIAQWLGEQDGWFRWWKWVVKAAGSYDERSYLEGNIDAGLLYMVSLRGYPNLVRAVLEQGADVHAQGGRY